MTNKVIIKLKDLLVESPDGVDYGDGFAMYNRGNAHAFIILDNMIFYYSTIQKSHDDLMDRVMSIHKGLVRKGKDVTAADYKVRLKNYKIVLAGEIDTDVVKGMVDSFDTHEYGRDVGEIHGRVWTDSKIISIWETAEDHKSVVSRSDRIEKMLNLVGINLNNYRYDEFDEIDGQIGLIPWGELGKSNTSKPNISKEDVKLKDEITSLMKTLSHGASKNEKIAVASSLKNIIDSNRKTSKLDFSKIEEFIRNVMARFTGSEEAQQRAADAGYGFTAAATAAMPFREETIKLTNLLREDPDEAGKHYVKYDSEDAQAFIVTPDFYLIGANNDVFHGRMEAAIRGLQLWMEGKYKEVATTIAMGYAIQKSLLRIAGGGNPLPKFGMLQLFSDLDINSGGEITPDTINKVTVKNRKTGILNGRLWNLSTRKNPVVSFWNDDDDVISKKKQLYDFLSSQKMDSKRIAKTIIDFHTDSGYYNDTKTYVKDLFTPKKVEKPTSKIDKETLDNMLAQLHVVSGDVAKKNKIKKKLKDLGVSDKALEKYMGSQVAMDRAKLGGYETVAQQTADRPVREENIKLKDLI